jgi:S-adenosylmethionine decarboxylase
LSKPFLLNNPQGHVFSNLDTQAPTAIPGTHIVANFEVEEKSKLETFNLFRTFIQKEIADFRLTSVGEVYHDFPNGGYTGVICLTESHLSIHTWPERNYLTFDIFLSNYLRDNRATTVQLYENVKRFFEARVTYEKTLNR